jgi:hypothetical protein
MRLTDCLAIYGAVLSTAVGVWNYLRARSKVRVLLRLAVDTVEGKPQHGLVISIGNPSAEMVHITHVSFLYPFESPTLRNRLRDLIRFKRLPRNQGWCQCSLSLLDVEDGCPVSIEPGKSHLIFVRHEVLEGLLKRAQSRRLKAVVQGALWRNKYSKAFRY